MAFDPNIGRGTQWRKGTSGNPGGRPRSRLLSEALRTRLAEVKPGDPAGGWKTDHGRLSAVVKPTQNTVPLAW